MKMEDFYPEIESACHALGALITPVLTENAASLGLTRQEASYFLAIPSFEPDPICVSLFQVRSPYTSASLFESCLTKLSANGYLEPAGAGSYHLNQNGLQAINQLNQLIYASISSIQTLPTRELQDLVERLKRLSDACAWAPEPPDHWSILHCRRLDPGKGSPLMVQIDQHLTELSAYRDDAHLAAWKGLVEEGHTWDVLTLLWTRESLTLEEINSALKHRGNSLDQTKRALATLYKKQWVEFHGEYARISNLGERIRAVAETETNRYYYAPFLKLEGFDFNRTFELLKKHRRGIPAV